MMRSPTSPTGNSRRRTQRTVQRSTEPCQFCVSKTEPDYKNPVELERYTSDRGRIVPRIRTGICRKHQRLLTVAIKRARHLALLPFVPGA